MNLLLDTHAFIWWDNQPDKLPPRVLELCSDRTNILILSVASIWEMQIKMQLGKLRINLPLDQLVESQMQVNNVQVLPIFLEHVLELQRLPLIHKDPFDRMLVAQAKIAGMVLVSGDHEAIRRWRAEQSRARTEERRPDLLREKTP